MSPAAMLVFAAVWFALLGVAGAPRVRRRWPGVRGEVAMLGLLTFIFCLFFWRLLFEKGIAVPKGGGDFNSFYYPLSAFAAGQIQSGHFPLWNPYLYAGAPFAADYQAAALYPPNLLVWAVARPFTYGTFEALAIFHVWWASLTAYGFARTIGLRRTPSLVAGVTFAYGGFMTAQLGHAPMVAVASWLPAVLAAPREFPGVAARRDDTLRAQEPGGLERHEPDGAAGPEHEHPVLLANLRLPRDRDPAGHPGDPGSRGDSRIHALRHG